MQVLTDYIPRSTNYRGGVITQMVPRVVAELGITEFSSAAYEVVDDIEYRVVTVEPTDGIEDYEVL